MLNEPYTLLQIISHCRITEIIYKQDLQSTEDVDKLSLLLESYCETMLKFGKDNLTFKELLDEVKFIYYSKVID